ncbi:MAG: hypothetical protein DI628_08665 [Blastochloris viridis]|uniref:Uncharacterized protein n=1 Tax=Blastochloris viridis TaxID=1079 RepID=A0A6N4RD52_BLAVI|nr:MAG: hypothetical protein DI628_08665 [Blastochloris viridis]
MEWKRISGRSGKAVGAAVLALQICVGSVYAQFDGTGGIPAADLYLSPLPETGLRVPPSGAINITPALNPEEAMGDRTPVMTGEAAKVGDVTNTLGCAGIGQGEFTSGLYNMPETYLKFQQDVNSTLSKNLLSLNFVMPQTSALFEQLNNIGNQRYDQFQRACNVTQLQQDAKQTYMQACVEKLTPERKKLIEEDNNKRPQNARIPEAQIGPMAYAQAWEVCGNQYTSNTTALDVRNTKLTDFYTKTRELERVNDAVAPLLCQLTNSQKASDDIAGCWSQFLIPQVRICLGNDLEGGCTDGNYGVKEPIITMQRLFDTMRFVMEDEVIARRVISFTTQLDQKNIGPSARRLAAAEASLAMSTATLFRGVSGTTSTGSDIPSMPLNTVQDYQLGYLSCKQNDILIPLKEYQNRIKEKAGSGVEIKDIEELLEPAYEQVVKRMKLPSMSGKNSGAAGAESGGGDVNDEKDVKAVGALLKTAIGCTANQSIPIFDPNITAALQTQCSAQDRSAFYTMAGYDVALTATRDVYRYTGLKLKQVYARLLTEAMVPVSDTTNTSVSPTLSPELNAKFATVVKDVMIPYVDAQIQRLDELNTTRGVFGQRVREIYNNKSGCMSQPAGFVLPNGRPATFRP